MKASRIVSFVFAKGSRVRAMAAASVLAAMVVSAAPSALANHPVFVEGETDFDGDKLVGMDEDTDSPTDGVFGTIRAALAEANGGVNQNGTVTIVTSGRFAEVVVITAANGNVVLEAAPGVDADIDAVIGGNPDGRNGARQESPGIIVNSPANRIVVIRNIATRNWTQGIQVRGSSRVLLEGIRATNNRDFGVRVLGGAKVSIVNSSIVASGFRSGAAPVDNTPNPGIGVAFEEMSSGTVAFSTITSSFAAGISNQTGIAVSVKLTGLNVLDNNPDFSGLAPRTFTIPTLVGL